MLPEKLSWFGAIGVLVGLTVTGHAAGIEADKRLLAESERVISPIMTVMEQPPGKVPSRDVCDGPLLGNGDLGAVISGPPAAQKFWISKNNFWRLKDGHRQGGPRLFGGLEINIPALSNASYRIEQHIYPAITISRFTNAACSVTMRSLVTATADYILVELSVEGSPVDVETKLWAARGRGSKESTNRNDNILWATKAFDQDVLIPTAAACASTVVGEKDPVFQLNPGHKVTIAVAMQSNYDAKEPLAAAQEMAKSLNDKKVKELMEQHSAWWRDFWAKSLVEIGDSFLEKTYYVSNYMIGSGLRDKDFPTGLFSLWVTDDDPRWAGDYHLNFDYQSQFYGLYSCNHIEQADTYHAPILAFMERGREYARKVLNVRGVYYCVGIGAKGIDTCKQGNRSNGPYQMGGCFMGQKCNAVYSVIPMSMHWYHTYDLDYAKTVYPFVLEVANFWDDYLRFEPAGMPLATNVTPAPPVAVIDGVPVDKLPVAKLPAGRYVIYNDSIQENSGTDVNSIMSLGLVRNAYETVLDMSRELGVDKDRRERWEHILKNLSALPTFQKDGKTVFRYTERGTEWIDGNSCGLQHIYPSGVIGLDDDPKLLEIGRNTINAAGRKWNSDNGENSHYPAAVRVGYDPDIILAKLTELWAGSRKMPNGMPDTIEQC
ncbi:MAG: hypothetical protein WCN95_06855, partial [bacterium]